MKNLNFKSYLLAIATILLAFSCSDPLGDDIDKINEDLSISKEIVYTLTDDDYDTADDVCSCSGFGNFSSDDGVRQGVPAVLAAVFPALGDGSSALVTYDFFNGSSPDIRGDQQVFTVTAEEYTELGFGFGNFSDLAEDVPVYADFKVGEGSDGDYLDVTHEFFNNGTTTTVTTRVVWVVSNNAWVWAEPLPDASYADFFNESPPDFSFEDEGEDNIPFWLKATKIFAVAGDQALIQWNWDNGPGTSQSVALYIFDGTNWNEYGNVAQITQQSLNFGHDGTTWVPDNTIKYTMGPDDWTAIAAASLNSNPGGSASVTQFGNFDLTLWTSEQIFEQITNRLATIFPNPEAGQKYLITYAVWRPGSGSDQLNIIWDGTSYSEITE